MLLTVNHLRNAMKIIRINFLFYLCLMLVFGALHPNSLKAVTDDLTSASVPRTSAGTERSEDDDSEDDDSDDDDSDDDDYDDDDSDDDDYDDDDYDDDDSDDDDYGDEYDEKDDDESEDADEVEFLNPNSELSPNGSAKIEVELEIDGELQFEVDVRGIPVGVYDLLVGGVFRGNITVVEYGNTTRGEVEYESFPEGSDERLLDFDPRGQSVEIALNGSVYFSGFAPNVASLSNLSSSTQSDVRFSPEDGSSESESYLVATTGNSVSGSVKISLEQEFDGERSFDVVARGLPEGSYDLVVDGVKQANLVVALRNSSTYGELEFESDPDDASELLLDFEVEGKKVEIKQGDVTYFSGFASILVSNPLAQVPGDLGYQSIATALLPDLSASTLSNGLKQSTWFGVFDDTNFPIIEQCVLGRVEYRFVDGRNLLVSDRYGVMEVVESQTATGTYRLFSYETGLTYALGATDAECSLLESGNLSTDDGYVEGVLPSADDTIGFYNLSYDATVETQEKSVETIQSIQRGNLAAAREKLTETELYRNIAVNNANRTIHAAQLTGVNTEFWVGAANDLIAIADQALIAAQQAYLAAL